MQLPTRSSTHAARTSAGQLAHFCCERPRARSTNRPLGGEAQPVALATMAPAHCHHPVGGCISTEGRGA